MSDQRQRWDRRAEESQRAYEAFCIFRDIRPGRSLDAAYRHATGQQEGSKRASGGWTRWYTRFEWKERAEAYDEHLELQARQAREASEIAQHTKDLQEYRARQQRFAAASAGAAIKLLQALEKRLAGLQHTEITARLLPQYLRAAITCAGAASRAEAEALGVTELLEGIDDAADAGSPD